MATPPVLDHHRRSGAQTGRASTMYSEANFREYHANALRLIDIGRAWQVAQQIRSTAERGSPEYKEAGIIRHEFSEFFLTHELGRQERNCESTTEWKMVKNNFPGIADAFVHFVK